jgi:hypothetical protein
MGEGRGVEKEKTCDMKTRKIIVEVICFVLMMNWFYEGIYKVANWERFAIWIKHAPLLTPIWQPISYGVPIIEIMVALFFLKTSFSTRALYISMGVLIVYVFWVMAAVLFTHRLFWPFHSLWLNTNWVDKMLISLSLCWIAFIAVLLSKNAGKAIERSKSDLHNIPANAS